MSEICLEDGTIQHEDQWFTADDLTKQIQEKMSSGDMKFAGLATLLEELKKAVEDSHKMDLNVVLSKDEYKKLKSLGEEDDRECIKKAIMAYIGKEEVEETKTSVINCLKCKFPIEIPVDNRPNTIECPECGTSGRLYPKEQ